MPPLLYLGAAEVERFLPPLPERFELVRETFAAVAGGDAVAPPAICLHPRSTGFADSMPAYAAHRDLTSIKWVCGDERNAARGLPYISGLIILNDSETGIPTTVMDGAAVTAARTAAVSGVSITALAPEGWSTVALIGYGVQGRAHAAMLRSLNPAATIVAATRSRPPDDTWGVEFVDTPLAAARAADIVLTAIPLSSRLDPPVSTTWLKPNALVLPIDDDASLDPGVVNDAPVFAVDDPSRYERDRQAGLFGGWRSPDLSVAELISAPPASQSIRVCMNQGLGLMDAPIADAVRRAAEREGAGTQLER